MASPVSTTSSNVERLRSPSTKIANLRAAFEQKPEDGGLKVRKREPPKESRDDRELQQLREQLEKEVELRRQCEEKCAFQERQLEECKETLEVQAKELQELTRRKEQPEPAADQFALQDQVTELKRIISTLTSDNTTNSTATDASLINELRLLHHHMQNWVVTHFRRAKTTAAPDDLCSRLEDVTDAKHVDALASLYDPFDPSMRLAVYQSTAMLFITDIFASPLLFGVAEGRQPWQTHVLQTARSFASILSPSAFDEWRARTLDSLRPTRVLQEASESAGAVVANSICHVLAAVTDSEPTDTQRTSLQVIIRKAITLAHLFAVQRTRYEFIMPSVGQTFDPNIMESDDEGAAVKCATFPAVIKLDEARTVLLKAKVMAY
ncbi:hypothetical protein K470DRAFT_260138 [Piedraia hortae CBS 480.64]|uniref:Uncharacterized protein n=1 Tax=Piedraia hortae CBS 480.64 TaxID=1314780 RepID=A0A6A7BUG6_9PEZI|nr:hypothetical protein K470DRAFT_260138 [Piedraia hortae CBS 480.64]